MMKVMLRERKNETGGFTAGYDSSMGRSGFQGIASHGSRDTGMGRLPSTQPQPE